ncbi:MAG: trypsin-like peptidase domain-containing protein [Moraxellaceae bacterium]|nr:trypsin-like peptidase domain-containing protein [Moraxellaceae bacterium]
MAVQPRPVCEIGKRCHVYGKGIQKFGTAFSQKMVAQCASSSVQIVLRQNGTSQRLASGTLLDKNLVLCALHTLGDFSENVISSSVFVTLQYELAPDSAPPGDEFQHYQQPKVWVSGTLHAGEPQAQVVRILETGQSIGADYALLLIKWIKVRKHPSAANVIEPPRPIFYPKPGKDLSTELLLIGHPWEDEQRVQQGQPTQASVGKVKYWNQMKPTDVENRRKGAKLYEYGDFVARRGHSGGGVFNQWGQLVGVFNGNLPNARANAPGPDGKRPNPPNPFGDAFLNIRNAVHLNPPRGGDGLAILRGWFNDESRDIPDDGTVSKW